MQTILPHAIRSRIQQLCDFLRRREAVEEGVEERGVVAAAGFEEEFAGGCALVVWGGG